MNKALIVILFTVALDTMGIGLIMPIVPELLRNITRTVDVAGPYGIFLSLYACMQFFFSPILGALSDRYGRRPVLLISMGGAAIDYAIMAFAPSLAILFLGRLISGISGASLAVATAYIADITPEESRAKKYGWMNACFGLGFIAGPVLGGFLGSISLQYPFFLAVALNGLNCLVSFFVMPESHPAEKRRKLELKQFNPIGSFLWAMGLKTLVPLLAFYFVMILMGQLPMSLWIIYCEEHFRWDSRTIGFSFAAFGFCYALSQAFLTGPITRKLGEKNALFFGLAMDVIGYGLFSFAHQGWMAFALIPFFSLAAIAIPALQSLTSKQVGEEKQGELQGTLASLMSVTSIIGPVIFTTSYAAMNDDWPGGIWFIAAFLYLACVPMFWRKLRTLTEE